MKGYEVGKNEYVEVTDEDLKKIAPSTASNMDILQFVASNAVDPIYFESSYNVAPDDKMAKYYMLFAAALRETGHDAIAKVAMHNREHIVLIGAGEEGLLLHTLFYPNELDRANMSENPTKYSTGERDLAKRARRAPVSI